MLVHPGNSRIRSRPTRIYLTRNSPKLTESKPVRYALHEKKSAARSSLLQFKFSAIAVILIVAFHWLHRPRGASLQKDELQAFTRLSPSAQTALPSLSSHSASESNDIAIMNKERVGCDPLLSDTSRKPNWKRPLVDRAMLDRVDGSFRVQRPEAESDDPADPAREPTWRPTVWEIPKKGHPPTERPATLESKGVEVNVPDLQPPPPLPTIYSPPERFLLPFRIAEQESRARMHLSQLIHLAKELNRTLVLPNVGKSRIGACYQWAFGTYYDLESLAGHEITTPEEFKVWVASHPSAVNKIVSIVSKSPQVQERGGPPSHEDIYFAAYQGGNDLQTPSSLPMCLTKRFRRLQTIGEASQILVNEDTDARMDDRRKDSFIALLKSVTIVPVERDPASNVSESGDLVAEPEVLIVDWNLRHPIFDATPTLQYSPQLHNLAKRLGPQEPYLAVHWRTETMASDTLSPCAYALVEALEKLLHEAKSKNVTSIWFASDYPRAIKRKEDGAEEASFTKSGTYKRLTAQLEAAINVLRESFSESGSLNDWNVRELLDVQRNELGDDEWLLDDIGARGILDKLISINAKKFISGSRACSRHRWVQFIALINNADEDPSSYTAQIIQARAAREEFEENIVDVFGR